MQDIQITINEKDGSINLLFNGYNIIAKTIYNETLTNKILQLIKDELKNDDPDFENLQDYLTMK